MTQNALNRPKSTLQQGGKGSGKPTLQQTALILQASIVSLLFLNKQKQPPSILMGYGLLREPAPMAKNITK